jgi:hypothetical protein
MEGNVWMQWFAQVVATVSNLFTSLNNPQSQSSGGASQSAQKNAADSTSTSTNATNQLRVVRNPAMATTDALFGEMAFNGKRICFTMERTAVAIPEGTYSGCKRDSQHFGRKVVGIAVPNRTDIECHPANLPCQLEGCIAVGESIDGDALDNSTTAFDAMMADLPDSFTVIVTSK